MQNLFPACQRRHSAETIKCHQAAIGRVIAVMKQNPSLKLDLSAMARTASMSPFHFLRVFEELTRISPARFLAALRIERAKRLLLESSQSVTSVCFDVGYSSLGTFTRMFTEFVGVPPNAFRKLYDELRSGSFEKALFAYAPRQQRTNQRVVFKGYVDGPATFRGFIFIGLFESAIPQRRPLAGTLLRNLGRFEFSGEVSDCKSYLLAAAFPFASQLDIYWLPRQSELLVASAEICSSQVDAATRHMFDLDLRQLGAFDPPILTALPLLVI